MHSEFSLHDGSIGENVIIFGVDMTSSVHINNNKKDILVLCIVPTQRLDNTTSTAEGKCLIKFSISNNKFCLSLQCNGSNTFSFVNATKIYQYKMKDSEIKEISFVFRKNFRRFFSQYY